MANSHNNRIETATILQKSCGHVGFVRSNYANDTISCSQCAIQNGARSNVPIISKIGLNQSIPTDIGIEEFEKWILERLDKKTQRGGKK